MSQYEFEDDEPYMVIEKHESAGIAPFLVGLAVGAGVALLFAPRSGAATRRDIKRRANRVKGAAVQVVTDTRRRVVDQSDSARQAIDLKKRQVNRAMDAGRMAARDARDELEQRIAETKAAYSAGASAPRPDHVTVTIAVEEIDDG
jgi:gas vesicle protein